MQFNFNPPKGFMGGGEVMYSFNFDLDSLNSLGLNMGIRKKMQTMFFSMYCSMYYICLCNNKTCGTKGNTIEMVLHMVL